MDATPARTGAYWAALPAREHLVQFYEEDFQILETLEAFVAAGLRQQQGVIVIATASHLHQLEQRLRALWVELDRARYEKRYLPVLASELLDKITVGDGLDDGRFHAHVNELVEQAAGERRRVRVFSELMPLAWNRGRMDVAVRIESLWHEHCEKEGLQVLCAYPRRLFTREGGASLAAICEAHSRVIEE